MTSTYGGQLQGIKISTRTKIMRFFVTLSFLTLEIIRYGCELALAQLPITAEMTNSTGVGKCSCQQERYKSKQPTIHRTIKQAKKSSARPSSASFSYFFGSRQILRKRIISKTFLSPRHTQTRAASTSTKL